MTPQPPPTPPTHPAPQAPTQEPAPPPPATGLASAAAGEQEMEARVLAAVRATGVPCEVLACDPALADTEAFCAHYGVPLERSANTILVASKAEPRQYAACVLLATTRLDVNKTVRRRLGVRRASFASPEETAQVTGMLLGGVTPLGLPDGLPVWVDARVLTPDWVILGGGSRSTKLKVHPGVLEHLPAAEIVDGLATDCAG